MQHKSLKVSEVETGFIYWNRIKRILLRYFRDFDAHFFLIRLATSTEIPIFHSKHKLRKTKNKKPKFCKTFRKQKDFFEIMAAGPVAERNQGKICELNIQNVSNYHAFINSQMPQSTLAVWMKKSTNLCYGNFLSKEDQWSMYICLRTESQ